ncbi:MAG TPA: hypothetical protein VIW02_01930, partial [Gammaproteobacteria bacterium]
MADARILSANELLVEGAAAPPLEAVRLVRADDADILLDVTGVRAGSEPGSFILTTLDTLSTQDHYLLTLA